MGVEPLDDGVGVPVFELVGVGDVVPEGVALGDVDGVDDADDGGTVIDVCSDDGEEVCGAEPVPAW